MNTDNDETDTWVALEAATRDLVVLLWLRNESCGPGISKDAACNSTPPFGVFGSDPNDPQELEN